jgi:hypothetical protein
MNRGRGANTVAARTTASSRTATPTARRASPPRSSPPSTATEAGRPQIPGGQRLAHRTARPCHPASSTWIPAVPRAERTHPRPHPSVRHASRLRRPRRNSGRGAAPAVPSHAPRSPASPPRRWPRLVPAPTSRASPSRRGGRDTPLFVSAPNAWPIASASSRSFASIMSLTTAFI